MPDARGFMPVTFTTGMQRTNVFNKLWSVNRYWVISSKV